MSIPDSLHLQIIGTVDSPMKHRDECPLQGNEGAPEAIIKLEKEFLPAIANLSIGEEIIVLTWMHLSKRDVLACFPRNEVHTPPLGVFSTRSPDRPNPIGLHRVRITSVKGELIGVLPMEVVDGTPVIDIKPVINDSES